MAMIYPEGKGDSYALAIERAFMDTFPVDVVASVFGGAWGAAERSRAPYTDSWMLEGAGIRLFASPNLTHACIEISGEGCERLLEMGKLETVLDRVADRVTRIDVACDIETDTKPDEFVAKTSHERMRASGYQKSETGETAYVGSQKSDRYARVYRYYEPHPRAHLLRVEHVFRRDYAKVVARSITEHSSSAVAKAAGNAFGWSHSDWRPDSREDVDISVVAAERKMGKTVFWLVGTVAPSFRRLCREGIIKDPAAFIARYFLAEA